MPRPSLVCCCLVIFMLILTAADCRRARGGGGGGGGRWKFILAADSQEECGSEFHDPQSKWLQSELTMQARWRSSDEHPADPSGAFNVTIRVSNMLSDWRRNLTGLRVTVGQFNRSLSRRQRSLQRSLCAPRNLPRNWPRGYILFLAPTEDPNYFRHRFLPVRNTRSNRNKIDRIRCRQVQHCPKAPHLTQDAQLRGGGGGHRRLTCSARGRPLPRPQWLKDGAEVLNSDSYLAQYRTKSGLVTTRLTLKNQSESAGNFTCVFRNLRGNASSTIQVTAMPKRRPVDSPASYLCDNSKKCLNGGTCTVDRLTNKPVCICPAHFTGTICEKVDFQEIASYSQKQTQMPSAALGVVFVAVFATLAIVLLSVCLLLYRVRRRLDRRHIRSRLSSRCDNAETQYPSNGLVATFADAETMTDAPEEISARRYRQHEENQQAPTQQKQQQQQQQQHVELQRLPDCVSANGGQPTRPARASKQPQPSSHSMIYPGGLPIRPIFDYSGGYQRDESQDLRAELGRLNQLERRQLLNHHQRQQQQQQPVTVQAIDESGFDEAAEGAATEALLPFPGHGKRRSHHSTS